MAATICPAVTVDDFDAFQNNIERLAHFAVRIHVDVADGSMTPKPLIPIDQVWWPGGVRADLHVMCKQPDRYVDQMIALSPQMVIIHAEADGNFGPFAAKLRRHGIEVGVALQQDTPASLIKPALPLIDHVLVFSGTLGSYGGTADLALLDKVRELKSYKPQLEIGWDGGINDTNVRQIIEAGVEVANAGGFINKAPSPEAAYERLRQAAGL